MDALGKRLVRSLLDVKRPAALTEAGVGREDIFDDGLAAYDWALKFVADKGDWPTTLMVEENTGIGLPDEGEPLDYIVDLIRKRSLGKALEKKLKSAAELIESRDPDSALMEISDAALSLRHRSTTSKVVSFRESAEERIDGYKKTREVGGLLGIHTPWSKLDHHIQGWVDGTLNVVTAMQNTGKTWFLVINASHCMSLGRKVLFVTMEMSATRIQRRLDALHYKIPFKDVRDAAMDLHTEARWKDEVLKAKETIGEIPGDVLFADKKLVRNVSDVAALVADYKPDILLLDGGYRLEGRGKGSWETAAAVVRDLQISAEISNIPWVVTTQQGDSSETGKDVKRGPKMRAWNVRYAKEWVIDPDVAIGLYANDDLRLVHQLEMFVLKMRDEAEGHRRDSFKINWDTGKMKFEECKDVLDDDVPEDGETATSEASHEVEY